MPFARRARIERLRDARVRSLVRYAAATVPHYRDAFRRLSLDPRDIRTAADLERLPLIRKEDLQRDPERFVSTSWLGRRSVEFVTSGTTGQRGRVLHDPLSLLANIAWGEREREVVTNLIGRAAGYREAIIGYPSGTIEKVWQFYRETTYVPTRPDRLVLSVESPLRENVEAVNRFGPDVLATFGSYLEALSRAVAAGGAALRQPRLLLYGAESLLPPARRDIEAVLGAPVLANYNAVEAFKIGFMCEERAGYHVHEDLAHLRIADADGRTVPDHEPGCIVLSNLVNRGTVLLNYRLSDVAAWAPAPCRCGRSFRLLGEIEGRIEDLLTLANGESPASARRLGGRQAPGRDHPVPARPAGAGPLPAEARDRGRGFVRAGRRAGDAADGRSARRRVDGGEGRHGALRRAAARRRRQGQARRRAEAGSELQRLPVAAATGSQLQRLPVAGQLQVAAPRVAPADRRAHGAFPVDRPGARAAVELLVVEQRLQHVFDAGDLDRQRDRYVASVRGERQRRSGVKRTSSGPNVRVLPSAPRSVPPAHSAPLAPLPGAHAERHQRAAVVEVEADPVPADRLGAP